MALLEVNDLSLHYGTARGAVRAVDSISFAVPGAGQAVGIIGETGSGKTSLVSALARILPSNVDYYGGEVLLDGLDLMKLNDDAFRRQIRWKKMAVVFQGAMNGFNPVVRVGPQIAERKLAESDDDRRVLRGEVEELLAMVGLPAETYTRYPHELSGGMKQRAAIAMALSMHPPVVILDEPTSALDVSVQAQIMNTLKRLKWELDLSMLLITHDIALASDLCDWLAVIYAGQIREYGPAESVLSEPQDPYTRELIASIPRLHGAERPRFVGGTPPDPTAFPPGCRFYSRCPHAFAPCPENPPPLFDVGPDHRARCWLHSTETTPGGKANGNGKARGNGEEEVPGPGGAT